MRYAFGKAVVIGLGGSIVHPDGIDASFIRSFRRFIAQHLRKGRKFIIVLGGGRLARRFQEAAGHITRVTDEDKDWLGIHATRMNAHLMRTVFREIADPVVIDERRRIQRLAYPVTFASGWKPGWSTDYIAVALAEDFGAGEVVIAGKPSHVFDKDHALHKDAKPIHELNWKEYRKLIPKKWSPGLHAPVDPVAAALAEKQRIKAIIINGKDIGNFGRLLNGKEFTGTIIGQ